MLQISLSILATALIGVCLAAFAFRRTGMRVRIPKAEIQRAVDGALPVAGTLPGITYAVTAARVDPRADGRVGIDADLKGEALGIGFALGVAGSGAIRYRDGSFHLADFRVERVGQTGGKPAAAPVPVPAAEPVPAEPGGFWSGIAGYASRAWDAVSPTVDAVRERAEAILAEAIERIPVHTLDRSDRRQALARLTLRDVRAVDGAIEANLDVPGLVLRFLAKGLSVLLIAVAGLTTLVVGWAALSTAPAPDPAHVVTLGAMGILHLLF